MTEIDLFEEYKKSINQYKLLSADEEQSLADQVQSGDKTAFHKLINSNLRLVINIAKKYATTQMPLLDLVQEGNIGLMAAAERFKSSFKVRFSTYACWWIKQYVIRSMQNKKRVIRLPSRKEILLSHLQKESFEFKLQNGRNPSSLEIAEILNTSLEEVTQILPFAQQPISLDCTLEDDDTCCFLDFVSDDTFNPEKQMMSISDSNEIRNFIDNCLKGREKNILIDRMQLNQTECKNTLKDLAKKYGVSPETIRQTEFRAIRKLKKNANTLSNMM